VSGPYVEQTGEVGGGEPSEVRAEIVRILDAYFRYTLQIELDEDIPFCADEIAALVAAAEERGARAERERAEQAEAKALEWAELCARACNERDAAIERAEIAEAAS
jgi:hypothetical protein